jgi:WD40 repeat protein
LRLDRTVAVKELLKSGDDAEARFIREALITARLQHPSIVPIHDLARDSAGKPFYSMKMVSGCSLAEVIEERRTLAERLALLPNVIAVADAMAYAHGQRVIHRDLKPANVLIGPFGETVVIDWGLAAQLSESRRSSHSVATAYEIATSGLTVAGTVMGTPEYMPVEQAEGKPVDERADVYAIGAILYHVLAGQPPYQGSNSKEVLASIAKQDPTPIEQRKPGVPKELATIIHKAMSRNANARYPTARELAEDLKRFQTGQLVSAHSYSRAALMRRWVRRYRLPVMVTAVFLLVLSIVGVASIRRIVRERNFARESQKTAVQARVESEEARTLAERRRDEMILIQARTSLQRDPTMAIAWLKEYPEEATSSNIFQDIAVDAEARGIAEHVLKTADTFVSFSPDGSLIATGGEGREIRLWDVETGTKVASLPHEGWIHGVRFSPSSTEVLFFGGWSSGIYVWDIATRRVDSFRCDGSAVTDAVFSPDAKFVAAATTDSSIRVWFREGGRPRLLRGHRGVPYRLSFGPGGIFLASGGKDKAVRIWNVVTGASRILKTHGDTRALVFSPDGRKLAVASSDSTVRIWDLATDEAQAYRATSNMIVWDVVFSPDGRILAFADHGGTIYLHDLESGQSHSLVGHSGAIYSISFSPDGGTLASGGQDATVRLWESSTGEPLAVFRGHESTIEQVAFSPKGGVLVSVSSDKTTRLWRIPATGRRLLRGHSDSVYDVALSPSGRNLASGSRDRTVRIWDLATGESKILGRHGDFVYRTSYSPDGKSIASGSADGTVRLWSVENGTSTVLNRHHNVVWDMAFSSDGRALVSADGDGVVRLWDFAHNSGHILQRHQGEVRSTVFSPDSKLIASSGADKVVLLYDLQAGVSRALAGHEDLIYQVSFSPNGKLLASASYDGTIRLWEVETGEARILRGHLGRIRTVSFSPDGKWLASGSDDHSVRLWSTTTDDQKVLSGHSSEIQQVIFSPNGQYLASASFDNTARLWDIRSASTQRVFRHSGYVRRIAFSADGRTLLSASVDQTIGVWRVEPLPGLSTDPQLFRNWIKSLTTMVTGLPSENHRR